MEAAMATGAGPAGLTAAGPRGREGAAEAAAGGLPQSPPAAAFLSLPTPFEEEGTAARRKAGEGPPRFRAFREKRRLVFAAGTGLPSEGRKAPPRPLPSRHEAGRGRIEAQLTPSLYGTFRAANVGLPIWETCWAFSAVTYLAGVLWGRKEGGASMGPSLGNRGRRLFYGVG